MKKIILALLVVAAVGTLKVPSAFSIESNIAREANTEVQLITEFDSVSVGQPFEIALRMAMDPEWHVYWRNPGDSGTTPMIAWNLPQGFEAREIQWPIPHQIDLDPLRSYGYEGEIYLRVPIAVPSDISSSTSDISAKVQWLACKIQCVPGVAELSLSLPVGNERVANPNFAPILEKGHWPVEGLTVEGRAFVTDENLALDIPYPDVKMTMDRIRGWVKGAQFFPYEDNVIQHAAAQKISISQNHYRLIVPRSTLWDPTAEKSVIKGLLVYSHDYAVELSAAVRKAPVALDSPQQSMGISAALLFAFLGGLILNLMPCVLPVLSIKILSLVKHTDQKRREVLAHGLSFTSGVIVMFWLLAGVILLLKSAGKQIGWGFQFQSPVFLIVMAGLFVGFALNMFGLFEIGPSLSRLGAVAGSSLSYRNSFLNGLLATIVATPCTAPFMGSAMGYAFAQSGPPVAVFLVFTFLGLGMALPFLTLSAFPTLLKFVPKPGPWMIQLKRIFGILFLLTAAWLVWVLMSQIKPAEKEVSRAISASEIQWLDFSPELVAQSRQEGRPVFIDFTAKWCLTCQVNERLALGDRAVIAKFKELGIVAVKADWTNYNSEITTALAQYGKNSIPLYVLYPGGGEGEPVIFPEIITPQIILNSFEKNLVE